MFRLALSESLGVPPEYVKLTVSEVGMRLRRLQPTAPGQMQLETKRYQVSYEVVPPLGMDPDTIVQRANSIAATNTSESTIFRQVLEGQTNIVEVGNIAAK